MTSFKYSVGRVPDFDLTGTGQASAWDGAGWLLMPVIRGDSSSSTRCKVGYSATGLYCLFDCEDGRLVNTDLRDNDDLWTEDVVEVFLQPDESRPVYFEYELSPLNVELPLMVPNDGGVFMGWSPWKYTGDRRVRHATHVRGGPPSPGAAVTGWSAEMFIPFTLLRGLGNVPPAPGTRWRANFYRIDHDSGTPSWSAWATGVKDTFHDYRRFGTLIFV